MTALYLKVESKNFSNKVGCLPSSKNVWTSNQE
jgi:hypothetical protein